MARILLGVTGGIAAYKALELVRLATKAGHAVRVIQTPTRERFVGRASFAALTGAPVLVSEFEPDPARGAFPGQTAPEHEPLSHLELVRNADCYLIGPASAHTLAKLAHGLADNLLTSAALEALVPEGVPRPLDGLRVLVTAGGTREPIDAVRFVGNRSSGRMGFALAEAAARRGAGVTVVAANVSLPRRADVEYVDVSTAAELAQACNERFDRADVLLMAAAVADYRPAEEHAGKLKKDATGERLTLELTRTEDVLSKLAQRRRPGQQLVGFAAEHGDQALDHGRDKLARKGLDAVVVNDVGAPGVGFES